LRWNERELPEQTCTLDLYRSALALRRTDPVWVAGTREELHAEVVAGALVVKRSRGEARRVLIMNLGDSEMSLAQLAGHLKLPAYDVQLRSSLDRGDVVPSGTAVVLAC
jgi:hypothetical protein